MSRAFPGSVKARLWAGFALGLIGLTVVITAIGPLRFAERFADRIEVIGIVQEGYDVNRDDGTEISDGQHGAWKVDYQVGDTEHVGFILGSYRAGQQVEISAPADGSVYGVLAEPVSPLGKVASWLLILLGVPAIVAGSVLMTQGIKERNRQIRAEVEARYGLPLLGSSGLPLAGPHPVFQPTTIRQQPSPHTGSWPGAGDTTAASPEATQDRPNPFFKPYDL